MEWGSVLVFLALDLVQLIKLLEKVLHRAGEGGHLFLELLDVGRSDIFHLVFIFALRLVLYLVESLSFGNLSLNVLNNPVHVLTFAHFNEQLLLENKHGLANDVVVEVDHELANLPLHVGELVHDGLELLLTETVTLHKVQCSVVVLRLVTKQVFIPANNGLLLKFDVEVLLLANVEAN